ncbi:hypothetical protein Nepgr_033812 [Nepenthes gracilis]|uniref:Uncharacterized protein n=1 Tax=Nepenthes gracilis TaxID=150966 RepID=A0AAD3TLB3_NEPGR|nr:hypothetical protein Nepgr_033812 [Nepenthes gracilis]
MGMETSDAVRTTKRGKVDNWLGGGEEIKFFMVGFTKPITTRRHAWSASTLVFPLIDFRTASTLQSTTKLSEDLSQQHEAFRHSSHIFPHKSSGDLSQLPLEDLWRSLSASLIALRRPLPTSLRSSPEISHSFPQKLFGDLSQ